MSHIDNQKEWDELNTILNLLSKRMGYPKRVSHSWCWWEKGEGELTGIIECYVCGQTFDTGKVRDYKVVRQHGYEDLKKRGLLPFV